MTNVTQVPGANDRILLESVVKAPKKQVPYDVKWYKNDLEISNITDTRYKFINTVQNDAVDEQAVFCTHEFIINKPFVASDAAYYKLKLNNQYETTTQLNLIKGIEFL